MDTRPMTDAEKLQKAYNTINTVFTKLELSRANQIAVLELVKGEIIAEALNDMQAMGAKK